ncbi:MAG: maltose alpha-D-glucosyltransferase [Burkholderiaceae bacterium]
MAIQTATAVRDSKVVAEPDWYKDAVIYELHIKAYADANGDGIGDFQGLTQHLDHVQSLGVNTIWLLPFYPSPLRDDGYDVADYEDVHPSYGTLDDFKAFLKEAHRRGLRVITELVVNHTSDQHPWFQAARNAPKGSPERDFYVWTDDPKLYSGTRIIFTDTEKSNWTYDEVAGQYFWHRFFSHQPDLNFDNPAVLEAVFKTMRFWLDLGVDGFRLDAIPYLIEREGTSNENLPETHAVIKQLRAAIDANYTNRFLLAEANMWPEDVREYFGDGDECHVAYHFPLMPRMYMAIAQEDRFPLTEIMEQTPDIPDACQWAIFLRNHDELTLEMVTSRERDYMYTTYAADPRARINLGIRRRLAPLMENDSDRIKLMNAMLLSMPGSPIIYYGDEIGMGDNVFVGDRNGVRTPMQWSPDRNAGFSKADPQTLYLQPILGTLYGYEALNVEAQARDPSSLLNWTRRMLAVRATSPAFGRGKRIFLKPGNRKILAYVSTHDGDNILSVFNLSRAAQPVELDLTQWKGCVPVEMLGRVSFPPVGDLPYLLTIPSHGFYWFHLSQEADKPHWHQEVTVLQDYPTLVLFDNWTSLFRDKVMPWRIGMAERTRRQFDKDALPRFIEQQRWYASKGDPVKQVDIIDHALWADRGAAWLLPIVSLNGPAADARYFVPLALAWEEEDAARVQAIGFATVAKVRQQAQVGLMGDAYFDPAFATALVAAMRKGLDLDTAHGQLRFRPSPRFAELGVEIDALQVARPGGHSSNTVVLLGDTLFLKAYRQLREGIHPELEMGRFLTDELAFANCVPVLGSLEYVAEDGQRMALAMVQAQVANQGDGWAFAVDYLERYLQAVPAPLSPLDGADTREAHGGFLSQIAVLGQRTAELHIALASTTGHAAFDPEPWTDADMVSWRAHAHAELAETLALLRVQLGRLDATAQPMAQALLERAPALQARINTMDAVPPGSFKTRYHGDFHLGQVLVTGHDFVIIDFEGEPARAFAQRRAKGLPLRDVAGMLRSFSYARWTGLRRTSNAGLDDERLAQAAHAWEQATRAAFQQAYDATRSAGAAHAPRDHALLELFEMDKALYELRYEINNRADWVAVPLHGILELLHATQTS